MPASERFVEDLALSPAGTGSVNFVYQLLKRLQVAGADRSVQQSTVSKWLVSNTPSPMLRADLIEAGFTVKAPAPSRRLFA